MHAPLPMPEPAEPPGAVRPAAEDAHDGPRAVIVFGLVAVVATAALVYAVVLARQVLLLVYVSALLAIGVSPVVRILERRRLLPVSMPRWAAILTIYSTLLAVVGGLALAVMPTLVRQTREFAAYVPTLVDQVQRWLVRRGALAERLTVREMVQQAPVGTDELGTLLATIWTLIGGVVGVLTILILTFYFLVEADQLFDGLLRLVPRGRRRQARVVSREIGEKVSAWLSGQLILAGAIGATSAVGFMLLGLPYFYVLAIIAAVGELIPYLGPLLAAVPAIAVASTVSWQLALGTAVFCFVQQQFENYVLVPRIMEQQVGLSAATVIVALLLGSALMGVVGAILAVPTAAILQVLFVALVPATED